MFKGLPTPANALAVISVVIAGHYSHSALLNSFTGSAVLLIVFTVILSLMMVIQSLTIKRLKGEDSDSILGLHTNV